MVAVLCQLMIVLVLAIFAVVNIVIIGRMGKGRDRSLTFSEKLIRSSRELRKYPSRRYYKLKAPRKQQPDFLTDTVYVYGEWPFLLHSKSRTSVSRRGPFKLAVDQRPWLNHNSTLRGGDIDSLPFADGTNPSILTMARIKENAPHVYRIIIDKYPSAYLIATICMTNSQCSWKDSSSDRRNFHIVKQKDPDTVQTLLLVLDKSYKTLTQMTIQLEIDKQKWGAKHEFRKHRLGELETPQLDDARLFVHQGEVYVSYREGKRFGYSTQVLNPISISENGDRLKARLRVSETSSFCCGRNMALMEGSDGGLDSLTWVDPVTVMAIDTTPGVHTKPDKEPKASKNMQIHGTNAFMVELPSDPGTYLGIGHFHRPTGRDANDYARFGHHYTHLFYTVKQGRLTGLSSEFVFESKYYPNDAEIIQFASGLEYDYTSNQLIIGYGINDCEGAITSIDLRSVKELLRPVPKGKQVRDLMKYLS